MESDLKEEFEEFAKWCHGSSPLYENISLKIRNDEEVLRLASKVPEDKSVPHMLFASVHYLLLRSEGEGHQELSKYYESIVGDEKLDPDGSFKVFREFCTRNRGKLEELFRTRRTQTNSVRRCAALLPVFTRIHSEVEKPLGILEIGPSAGLNLMWDRYGYRYGGKEVGDKESVVIESEIHPESETEPPLPSKKEGFPEVEFRMGVDLKPLDITDDEDYDWLRALVWPEQTERHEVLEKASEVVRRDPPEIVEGDAVEKLEEVAEQVPSDCHLCIYNTQVLYQFEEEDREKLKEKIEKIGGEKDLHWISGEKGVDEPSASIVLEVTSYEDGEKNVEEWGQYEAHGNWILWYSDSS